jgi:hypothetical protein
VRDLARRQDLAGTSLAAQPRRQVQRAAAIPALDLDRLAGVEADPDRKGQLGIGEGLLDEPLLELDGRADRLARRAEDAERLVSAELQERAAAGHDPFAGDPGELRRQLAGRLVAPLLREERVAAHVRDQEGPDVDVVAAGALRSPLATGHGRLWSARAGRS